MNHGYVLCINGEPVRCTVSLMLLGGRSAILSGIEVAFNLRGKGYATELLKLVLADADKEDVILLLSVSTDNSPKSLSNTQLCEWYERHGFYPIEGKTGTGTTMQRLPNTP